MSIFNASQTPEEILAKKVSALSDSISVIDAIIDNEERYASLSDEEKQATITRNSTHLEIMLENDEILQQITDATIYTDAIQRAKNYLGI